MTENDHRYNAEDRNFDEFGRSVLPSQRGKESNLDNVKLIKNSNMNGDRDPQTRNENRRYYDESRTYESQGRHRYEKYPFQHGDVFRGTVTRIERYGCFVEINIPSNRSFRGLVHISEIADHHVKEVTDEIVLDQQVFVMITRIQESEGYGRLPKINFSIAAVDQETGEKRNRGENEWMKHQRSESRGHSSLAQRAKERVEIWKTFGYSTWNRSDDDTVLHRDEYWSVWGRSPSPPRNKKKQITTKNSNKKQDNGRRRSRSLSSDSSASSHSSSSSSSSKSSNSSRRGKRRRRQKSTSKRYRSSRKRRKTSENRRNRKRRSRSISSSSSSSSSSSFSSSSSSASTSSATAQPETKSKNNKIDDTSSKTTAAVPSTIAAIAEEINPEDLRQAEEFKRAVQTTHESSDEDEGPQPLPVANTTTSAAANSSSAYGKALLPGEGAALAQYVQQNLRIPRRGEIGYTGDEISGYEKSGYVMSGSRHARMNAVRIRKENQVYSAEEQRALALITLEENQQKEAKLMQDFREMLKEKKREKLNALNRKDRLELEEHEEKGGVH